MDADVRIPQAFSVRDENEFLAFEHLLARLNPQLRVKSIGVGLHVEGGYTVYWGLVYLEGQKVTAAEFDAALDDAGFHFQHSSANLDYSVVSQ